MTDLALNLNVQNDIIKINSQPSIILQDTAHGTGWCSTLNRLPSYKYNFRKTTDYRRGSSDIAEASKAFHGFSDTNSPRDSVMPIDGLYNLCITRPLNEAVKIVAKIDPQHIENFTHVFAVLVFRCAHEHDLRVGREVQELVVARGLGSDDFIGNLLIQMFVSLDELHEAFLMFSRLAQPDQSVLVMILKACSRGGMVHRGQWIHGYIVEFGLLYSSYIQCTLIYMYINCQGLTDAYRIFATLPFPSVEAWNALMMGFVDYGYHYEGLQIFKQMQLEGLRPSRVTFICALKACSKMLNLEQGRKIHSCLVEAGLESGIFVGNSLIDMYVKCRSIQDAAILFDRLSRHDTVSCNALIIGYAKHYPHQVLHFFRQMAELSIEPDVITFVSILKACCSLEFLEKGRQIHAYIVDHGFVFHELVGNAIINMYSRCDSLTEACYHFVKLPQRNVVSWSTLIAAHVENGHSHTAVELFFQMQLDGVQPNQVTFIHVLTACTALDVGKMLHRNAVENGHDLDMAVGNALVHMYARCGSLEDASMTFHRMPSSDVITWTALIDGYVQHGLINEGFLVFEKMQSKGLHPNGVTFLSIAKACTQRKSLQHGRSIHVSIIEHGLEDDGHIGSTLITMYSECGHLEEAQCLFNRLPRRSVAAWNTLIGEYAQQGKPVEALWLYQELTMDDSLAPDSITYVCVLRVCIGISAWEHGRILHAYITETAFPYDVFICNTLVDMYAKCGSVRDAYNMFFYSSKQSIMAWNTLLRGLVDNEYAREALQVFWKMQGQNMEPDVVTLLCILKACSSILALEQGKLIHEIIIELGFEWYQNVANTLIGMYSSCGGVEDAQAIFNSLAKPDIVSWSALLGGYAKNTNYLGMLSCYKQMQEMDLAPDGMILASVLNACSHSGLLKEGCEHFNSIRRDFGLLPAVEHVNSMVYLLSKLRRLDEAEDLMETVPFRCNVVGWTSLLHFCGTYFSVGIGERCLDYLSSIDPENAGNYVLMVRIYSHVGKLAEAENMDELRKCLNAWKKPAKAFIEVDHEIHEFNVGDKGHEKSMEIYSKVKSLNAQFLIASSHYREQERKHKLLTVKPDYATGGAS